jgi:mannose-6-phosphate isomerase-like protein (cupin superfamily)
MSERAEPYILAPGQERSHPGSSPVIKAGAADTDGLLTVAEGLVAPRSPGPPLHIHDEMDEMCYVLEGEAVVQVGDDRHVLVPGCFAWVPRGVPHTFANLSDRPVRLLGLCVPAGIEEFFAAQAAYLADLQGPPDPGRLAAIWAGHPGSIVGPPIEVGAP